MRYQLQCLGEHIDVISGYAFKSSDFVVNGIPIIKIKNIIPPYVSLDDVVYVGKHIADELPKYELQYDDVLISLTGSNVNQMASVVGKVGRVKYRQRSMLNQRVGKIIVKNDTECNLDFVYYYLSQEKVKVALARVAGGAANQANISPSDIKNLEIPFPKYDVQKNISTMLRNYDDLIENNQKQIKLLQEAATLLYNEWFVKLRFPGHETTRIIDGLPDGWFLKSLSEVCQLIRRGISPKYNDKGDSTVINQKCIRNMQVDMTFARQQEKPFASELQLQDGDIVICSTGEGTLGRVGQITGQYANHTFDSHVTLVRASADIGANYLGRFIYSQEAYFVSMGKGSTNQTELSRSAIETLKILIPPVEIMNEFEKYAQQYRKKLYNCKRQIILLRQTRDKLLPKLMSGEIEV